LKSRYFKNSKHKSSFMSREKLKKVAYSVGKLLGFLGLAFLFYKLSTEYTLEGFYTKAVTFISELPFFILLNLLSSMIGIYVWHLMLKKYAKRDFTYLISYYYFAKTEIAKYLPGNLFHFVGRQAMASKLGITQIEMAKISLLFTLLLAIGTLLASTFFALLSTVVTVEIKAILVGVTLLSLFGILLSYPLFTKREKLLLSTIFAFSIALQGVLLAWLVQLQLDSLNFALFFEVAAIYIISWLIGFVTPGASGGLGVREGAFIAIAAFLHLSISQDIVLFSILFVRFINILVDLLLFLSTFFIEKRVDFRGALK